MTAARPTSSIATTAGPDTWGEVAKLTASDPENLDYFGVSVAVSGNTIIVGAHGEDGDGGDRPGAAYIFERDYGGVNAWGERIKLTASDAENYDYFGASVALSGDMAIVGADNEDQTGTDSGAAYVFNRHHEGEDTWGEVAKLTASDAQDRDNFGWSVGLSGDTAIVGANLEDGGGASRGAAYVYTTVDPDFDKDGDVDGFDFLYWQRDTTIGDLADWEANYGQPTTATAAAVPEPVTLILALFGLAFRLSRRSP